MRTTHTLLTAAMLALVALAMPACESNPSSSNGAAAAGEYVGTLRSDAVAIGGETTGWVLKRPKEPDLEVDISDIQTEAEALTGLRVRIRGRIEQRNYVERGRTPVLVAERIEMAG